MIKIDNNKRVFVTSDLHFGHDREFIWRARGYNSCFEMNIDLVRKFNSVVTNEDEVFILGDLTLGDIEVGKSYLAQLNGNIHVVLGNHDTERRRELYQTLRWDCYDALRIKYNKYNYFLCHYPTITANLEEEKISLATINLFGHTHQKTNFYMDMPLCYHVGVDSHNGYPVDLNTIPNQIRHKILECKKEL